MLLNENKFLDKLKTAARRGLLLLGGLCLAASLSAPVLAADAARAHILARETGKTDGSTRDIGKPGEDCWAFGESAANGDALWQHGVNAAAISRQAVPHKRGKSVNTANAINQALNEAEKKKPKGTLGMSMDNQVSSWKVEPGAMRADELMPRDTKHVVRAFADVKPGDGLDVSVGPELILRDGYKGTEKASEDQPDTSLGVGMRFKYDF